MSTPVSDEGRAAYRMRVAAAVCRAARRARPEALDALIHADVAAHLIRGATPEQRANLHILARAVRTELYP
ncbi:hypothetical protein [Sanguibacter sp. HDW7]|uniref:hypothetical protein n=1 Tax=Sanguibacter sp. HDW7 TaxID=2714931 RepID=UPI00140CBCCC|nr:hypothetical protein [Sanguibacter sp. HDW7]QIK83089.1 hypothetical protein G7063_05200 [Sanguibacter sp. HDW7]